MLKAPHNDGGERYWAIANEAAHIRFLGDDGGPSNEGTKDKSSDMSVKTAASS